MPVWNNSEESPEESAGRILKALAAELELDPEGLALEDGYTCLAVNGTSVLHLRLAGETPALDLFMELGVLPSGEERSGLCEDMLQGNMFFQGTGGPALGLDRERGVAALNLRLFLPGLNIENFRGNLEIFLAAAEFWRARIAGGAGGGEKSDTSAFIRV
ncbi:MAG: type III secretion system chaperone [Deltaproteobacteria bacterium]|jgi:hypothetical protein|nr:type III secretion system chaperone [Deltaproteobacteria bacterium]